MWWAVERVKSSIRLFKADVSSSTSSAPATHRRFACAQAAGPTVSGRADPGWLRDPTLSGKAPAGGGVRLVQEGPCAGCGAQTFQEGSHDGWLADRL